MYKATSSNMMADIYITPLVDVMLVLLVIFMLVAPAMTQTLSQNIGQSPIATKVDPHKLIVQAGDTYQLDGQFISLEELRSQLTEAVKSDNKYAVQVFGEPEASDQSFTEVMAIAKNAGVERLSLASN